MPSTQTPHAQPSRRGTGRTTMRRTCARSSTASRRRRAWTPSCPKRGILSLAPKFFGNKGTPYYYAGYGASYIKALLDIYPNIGLEETKFLKAPTGYWTKSNIRKYFANFAAKRNFDPLLASNWYQWTAKDILAEKGSSIMNKYRGSIKKALKDVYPDLALEDGKFHYVPTKYWTHSTANRRKFFDDYAVLRGFDPLVARNWYGISAKTFYNKGPMPIYKNSLSNALITLYPDIGLVKSEFRRMPADYWGIDTRRQFFDDVAKHLNFDPLVPSNWHSIRDGILRKYKGYGTVKRYYRGNIVRGLVDVYRFNRKTLKKLIT